MKRLQQYHFLIPVLLLSMIWVGCSLLGFDTEEARIVFGDSIEGVHIGDSKEEVLKTLGEPDHMLRGDFPGVSLRYEQGKLAGMAVTIWTETGDGVKHVRVAAPYDGATGAGLGIGSPRSEVHEQIGQPDRTNRNTQGNISDTYAYDEMYFVVTYRRGRVVRISMGTHAF
jgi:hypothetical protein